MSLSKHVHIKITVKKVRSSTVLMRRGVDYCRCFVLCNKWTHHHRIPLVSSLPVDVYARVFMCVLYFMRLLWWRLLLKLLSLMFLTISPADTRSAVGEPVLHTRSPAYRLLLCFAPRFDIFLFSTSVSTPLQPGSMPRFGATVLQINIRSYIYYVFY